MPDLESHWLAERLAYLGRSLTGGLSVETKGESDFSSPQGQTQRLKADVGLWAKHCLSASAERPFITFLGPVTFHGLEKSCIRS